MLRGRSGPAPSASPPGWLIALGVGLAILAAALLLGLRLPLVLSFAFAFPTSRALYGSLIWRKTPLSISLGRRQAPRRREQGVWADPPVAQLDKSTLGLLLADRLRRDPRLRVVVPRPEGSPSRAAPGHALWDRELDG